MERREPTRARLCMRASEAEARRHVFGTLPNLFESMTLERKAVMVGESTSQALCRWSCLVEWCTRAGFESPLAPPPMPRAWKLVPSLSAVVFRRQKWARQGAAGGKRGIPARACTEYVCTLQAHARLPVVAPHAPLCCVRLASEFTMVCRGGGGATALVGEGVVKELCAFASTWTSGNAPCLHLRGGAPPFLSPFPPSPLACA